MRVENLDLNLLRVFDVVYRERNLTRASEVLHISQPAVSNALQRLRDALGDPLFIRERRGVDPTAFADSIASDIQNALHIIRDSISSFKEFDPATSRRTFKVSMNDPVEALFLPNLLLEISSTAPYINILSSFVSKYDLANEMSTGNVDIGLDVFVPNDDRLVKKDLLTESYVCLVRQGHPLAKGKLSLKKYLSLSHIHVSARRHGLGYIDRILQDENHKREIRLRTRNMELAANIVKATDYSMTVPDHFAKYYDLVALELPFKITYLKWRLYWPRRSDHDPGNQWLRGIIEGIASKY